MSDSCEGAEFTWPMRVYYEDTDAGGIVYHANYLCFLERARTEWLREMGFDQSQLVEQLGIQFVVSKLTIDYQQPLLFDDEFRVASTINRLGRASVEFSQKITRQHDSICAAEVRVGCLDIRQHRVVAIPDPVYAEMRNAS